MCEYSDNGQELYNSPQLYSQNGYGNGSYGSPEMAGNINVRHAQRQNPNGNTLNNVGWQF